MHLLREGQFSVASTFLTDATNSPRGNSANGAGSAAYADADDELGVDSLRNEALRKQFADMYFILHQLKDQRNLRPAIAWARSKSAELEIRGSNLEFDLGRLQFIWLFTGGSNPEDPSSLAQSQRDALQYARSEFAAFQTRYLREVQQLCAAMAFSPNLAQSPYRRIFHNDTAWEEIASAFTREFCSLLGLSADSPLYVAATAGAIALPTLQKLQSIMQGGKAGKASWTSQNELPVCIDRAIPLRIRN